MRSSKSRSRSKSNRSRSIGNIVNRVFDSSGPEGKVRGTPQQIIEKYIQLARDAQVANDRVAAENFQQHAEHYARMLGTAQREMDARRDNGDGGNQSSQHGQGNGQNNGHQNAQSQPQPQGSNNAPGNDNGHDEGSGNGQPSDRRRSEGQASGGRGDDGRDSDPARSAAQPGDARRVDGGDPSSDAHGPGSGPGSGSGPESDASTVVDIDRTGDESTLVETPEAAPKPRRTRTRKPRVKNDADGSKAAAEATTPAGSPPDAAE